MRARKLNSCPGQKTKAVQCQVSGLPRKTEAEQASHYYRCEEFPEKDRLSWGISDKDFEEIKLQLVGTCLPPARITQKELKLKGCKFWGHYKGVAA
ncbi:hypothetical protein WJX77_004180 [Trebouxia sp. C0004]